MSKIKIMALETIQPRNNGYYEYVEQMRKNKKMALEGLSDFLFGKKKEIPKQIDILEHLEDLKTKDYNLKHNFKDSKTLLEYIQEHYSKGLPFYENELKRMTKIITFIKGKGKSITSEENLKQLYNMAATIDGPNYDEKQGTFNFKTFYVSVDEARLSDEPNFREQILEHSDIDLKEDFNEEEILLLCFPRDLISILEDSHIKNFGQEKNETIETSNSLHTKLLDSAISAIKKSRSIKEDLSEKVQKGMWDLERTLIPEYGDGDEYAFGNMLIQSMSYLYTIDKGFERYMSDVFGKK